MFSINTKLFTKLLIHKNIVRNKSDKSFIFQKIINELIETKRLNTSNQLIIPEIKVKNQISITNTIPESTFKLGKLL